MRGLGWRFVSFKSLHFLRLDVMYGCHFPDPQVGITGVKVLLDQSQVGTGSLRPDALSAGSSPPLCCNGV